MTAGRALAVALLAVGMAGGCAATQQAASRSGSTTAVSTAKASQPVPHPSPATVCDGISGLADAERLVDEGAAALVVTATISAQPGPSENNARLVPVDDYQVLAGLPLNGALNSVEEGDTGNDNALPPGTYLLLLGTTPSPSVYFLSDGVRGSFAESGTNAYERCPNPVDPAKPIEVNHGITDVSALANLLQRAIDIVGSLPSTSLSAEPRPSN